MNSINTAFTGLNAFKNALNTTNHNIANVATEGYSRQRVNLSTNNHQQLQGEFYGSGVHVSSVERLTDQFVNGQIRSISAEQNRLDSFSQLATRVDRLLVNDYTSLTPQLQGFFTAIDQANTDPSSTANRQAVLANGQNLADRFQALNGQLTSLSNETNDRIKSEVQTINALSQSIANLNSAISSQSGTGTDQQPNDLLDQRELLLQDLSQHVDFTAVTQSNNAINIYIGNGIGVVNGSNTQSLSTTPSEYDPSQLEIAIDGKNISNQINGGALGGVLDFRQEMLNPTTNQLGRIATVLSSSFNEQHQKGMDLDGLPGEDIFSVATPKTYANRQNMGTGSVTAEIIDPSTLTTSDYIARFDGANYAVTRISDSASVTGAGPIEMDGLRFEFTGAAAAEDSFLVRPTADGAKTINLTTNDSDRLALGAPVRSTIALTNAGDASIQAPQVMDADNPALSNTVEIRFTSPNNYDLVDVNSGVTIANNTYTENTNIALNGWRTSISGTPQAGDVFTIEVNTAGISDNNNGQQLAKLQFDPVIEGNSTYQEGYGQLINDVGNTNRQTQIGFDAQSELLNQAQTRRDTISGVNLDEEAANLLRYQQAYQASAQAISVSNDMFNSLLNILRR